MTPGKRGSALEYKCEWMKVDTESFKSSVSSDGRTTFKYRMTHSYAKNAPSFTPDDASLYPCITLVSNVFIQIILTFKRFLFL